jgi:serpin B
MGGWKRRATLLMIGVLVAGLSGCGSGVPEQTLSADPLAKVERTEPSADQAKAISALGEKLLDQLRNEENPVISPVSIFYAVGMAQQGARSDTAAAFEETLGVNAEQARAVAAYLLEQYANVGGGTTLSLADSAWLDDSLAVEPEFIDIAKAYYDAEVIQTDLGASGVVNDVNDWISEKTNGKIPAMLDNLDPETAALLINALYLKALWTQEFDTSKTIERAFTLDDGASVQVPFMYSDSVTTKYIETEEAEGALIPYQDGRLAFLAVKPTQGGLDTVALDGNTIAGWLAAVKEAATVQLSMPKFETSFGADLVQPLTALGLGVAFCPNAADFSGMGTADGEGLCIGKVVHKVNMAVGEKGTEAAAATVVEMMPASAPMPAELKQIDLDKPYFYAVVDTQTGIPLFAGTLNDPSKAPPALS